MSCIKLVRASRLDLGAVCIRIICLAITVVIVPVGSARAGMLLNPSFEQPVLLPGTDQVFSAGSTIGAGWVVEMGESVVITDDYALGGVIWPDPTDGSQFLYVGNNLSAAAVYQDVVLGAATPYRLTFDLANFLSPLGGARLEVDVLFNGSSILGGAVSFDRPAGAGFAGEVLEFMSNEAGTYRVSLTSPNGFGTNVDNFILTSTTVPEPASLTTAAIGGLVMAAYVWLCRR